MAKVDTSQGTLVFWLVAGLALTGPTSAQAPVAPKVPVAVNAPGAAPDAAAPKSLSRPEPITPATPRVGPAPAGQVVADDYRIGPQDLLEIQVYGIDNLKRDVRVNSRGAISSYSVQQRRPNLHPLAPSLSVCERLRQKTCQRGRYPA